MVEFFYKASKIYIKIFEPKTIHVKALKFLLQKHKKQNLAHFINLTSEGKILQRFGQSQNWLLI